MSASGPFVTIAKFGVNIWAIISAMNWNNSILLSLCLRKLRQFVVLCNLASSSLTAFGPGVCFKTGRAVHIKDYVCHVILAAVCLYLWQEVQSCIALKCLSSPRWQGMHQCWTIHDEDICLGFLVCWYNTSLKDRYELWLLATVQRSTLTQHSWECLVLVLEELLQIALSALTGDEQLWE